MPETQFGRRGTTVARGVVLWILAFCLYCVLVAVFFVVAIGVANQLRINNPLVLASAFALIFMAFGIGVSLYRQAGAEAAARSGIDDILSAPPQRADFRSALASLPGGAWTLLWLALGPVLFAALITIFAGHTQPTWMLVAGASLSLAYLDGWLIFGRRFWSGRWFGEEGIERQAALEASAIAYWCVVIPFANYAILVRWFGLPQVPPFDLVIPALLPFVALRWAKRRALTG